MVFHKYCQCLDLLHLHARKIENDYFAKSLSWHTSWYVIKNEMKCSTYKQLRTKTQLNKNSPPSHLCCPKKVVSGGPPFFCIRASRRFRAASFLARLRSRRLKLRASIDESDSGAASIVDVPNLSLSFDSTSVGVAIVAVWIVLVWCAFVISECWWGLKNGVDGDGWNASATRLKWTVQQSTKYPTAVNETNMKWMIWSEWSCAYFKSKGGFAS